MCTNLISGVFGKQLRSQYCPSSDITKYLVLDQDGDTLECLSELGIPLFVIGKMTPIEVNGVLMEGVKRFTLYSTPKNSASFKLTLTRSKGSIYVTRLITQNEINLNKKCGNIYNDMFNLSENSLLVLCNSDGSKNDAIFKICEATVGYGEIFDESEIKKLYQDNERFRFTPNDMKAKRDHSIKSL
ncbi:hypothetical protein [Carp edema virus]|nr:hypothetical protein [Carp edema virus]